MTDNRVNHQKQNYSLLIEGENMNETKKRRIPYDNALKYVNKFFFNKNHNL